MGVPRDILMASVDQYAQNNNLHDIAPLLRKGAIAAQSPELIQSMPELDDHEKDAFRKEIEHRWQQPRILYFSIFLSSVAAAIQGWDQTGSNGANLSFPAEFGISDTVPGPCEAGGTCSKNQWLVGLINSMPYFAIFLL